MTYCGDQILQNCQECIFDELNQPKIVSYNSIHDCTRCSGNNIIVDVIRPCQECTETYGTGDAWKKKTPSSPLTPCHKCTVKSGQEFWIGCPDNSECVNGDCKPLCDPPCGECEECECSNINCTQTKCVKSCDPTVSCFGNPLCKELTVNTLASEDNTFLFFDVGIPSELEDNVGTFVLTFYSSQIIPSKNPLLIHVRYDDESGELVYENVTSEVHEGSISGIVNSLSPFVVLTETPTAQSDDGSGGFDPCLIVSGCSPPVPTLPGCTFDISVAPLDPCPGNQTRGNWAIENGVPTPRLLATKCDCYVPSLVSVDMVVGAAGAIGGARALACAIASQIRGLGIPRILNSIKALKSYIFDVGKLIANLKEDIRVNLLTLDKFTDEASDIIYEIDELRNNTLPDFYEGWRNIMDKILGRPVGGGTGNFDDFAKDLSEAWDKYQEYANDPTVEDPSGIFRQLTNLDADWTKANQRLEALTDRRNFVDNKIGSLTSQLNNAQDSIYQYEGMLFKAQDDLTTAVANLARLEGEKATLTTQLSQAVQDAFVSAATMYALVNEISVKKTCESNQTLNPYTCECCDPCPDGKVFPDPMNGCSCVCPSDKIPCLSVADDGCYDPCPEGEARTGPECECYAISETMSYGFVP